MGRRILIVDDEQRVHVSFERVLLAMLPDCEVVAVSCGREGLAQAAKMSPELIILEVVLPDLDGLEVCQELRARHASPRVPILMASGVMMDAEARARALQVGADGYLCKPFEPIELIASVTSLLRMRDYEEQLRHEGEVRYRKLFELVDDAVILFDQQTLQFVDVNPAAERMYGYSREAFLALRHPSITAEPPSSQASIDLMPSSGSCATPFRWHRRCDGSVFPVSIAGCEIALDGRPVVCGICRDISAPYGAASELEQSHREVRKLATECRRAREDESRRITREMHDELGQALTSLKMDVSWLVKHEDGLSAASRNRLAGMDGLIETTVNGIRRICSELRPGMLDDLGLVPAIESLANEFSQRTGVVCHLRLDERLIRLSDDAVTALFRIAREALSNVTQHADASTVDIALTADDHAVCLTVRDDGRGMDVETSSASGTLGLRVMRERVLDVAGHLEMVSSPGTGTMIEVRVPGQGTGGGTG